VERTSIPADAEEHLVATPTKNLKLMSPTTSSQFSTADIAGNWGKIDAAPGVFICTSTSRPTLVANQAGRKIYETDTDLDWTWTGTLWRRTAPKGLLKTTSGGNALAQRTTDFQTTSTTPTLVLAVSNVVVPPGNRTLMISIVWSRAYSSGGYFYARCYRSNVSNSGPLLMQWAISGDKTPADANAGGGGTYVIYEKDGLNPGVYNFSFQIAVWAGFGGSATVTGTPTYPNEIAVLEV
jgi:hypothetical protein